MSPDPLKLELHYHDPRTGGKCVTHIWAATEEDVKWFMSQLRGVEKRTVTRLGLGEKKPCAD